MNSEDSGITIFHLPILCSTNVCALFTSDVTQWEHSLNLQKMTIWFWMLFGTLEYRHVFWYLLEIGCMLTLHPVGIYIPSDPSSAWGLCSEVFPGAIGIMAWRIWILFWSVQKALNSPPSQRFQVACSKQKLLLPLSISWTASIICLKKEFSGKWKILWCWINQENYVKPPFLHIILQNIC